MADYKIFKVTGGPGGSTDFKYEEMGSEWSVINNWEFKYLGENELKKDCISHYDISKIDQVKTYYFIPGTKFDRAYFKRLYPNLTYTRKIDKADIVLYDKKIISNTFFEKDNWAEIGLVKDNDRTVYLFNDYKVKNNFRNNYNTSYHGGTLVRRRKTEFDGKLLNVDQFFANMETKLLRTEIDGATLLTLVSQIQSKNVTVQRTAVETLLGLDNTFQLTKDIILSLLSNKSKMGSTKLDFYMKNCIKFNFRDSKYYPATIFQYMDDLHHQTTFEKLSDKDKELALLVLNSLEFQKRFVKCNIDYTLTFKFPGDKVPDKEVSIDGFRV